MKVGYGKIGKSILFNESLWAAIGGDCEAPAVITSVARYNPDDTFYLIGKSDFSRLSDAKRKEVAPNNNIIDVWGDFRRGDNVTDFVVNWFEKNNVKLDTAFFYGGPAGNANMPDKIKTVKGDRIAKVLECFENYVGPIAHYLNVSGIDYFTLTPDPRYHPIRARDLYNISKFALSQFNSKDMQVKHIVNYEDQSYLFSKVPTFYTALETVFLIDKKKPDLLELAKHKKKKFMVVLNEGGNGGLSRGPELKRWVLNHLEDVDIYGKWSDEWMKDTRFKGSVKFQTLQDMLPDVKYTFIIPIQRGWATMKFWEVLQYGIIPFMHPWYDEQMNLDVPEFIRVETPEELFEKIEFLENNPAEYTALLEKLNQVLKNKYYTGEHINNLIMKSCYRVAGKDASLYELTSEKMLQIDSGLSVKMKAEGTDLSDFFS